MWKTNLSFYFDSVCDCKYLCFMQAKLNEIDFKIFADALQVDWYYDYIENLQQWSAASLKYRKALEKLAKLTDSDWEKFVAERVPEQIKNQVIIEMEKIKGTYSDDFKFKKLTPLKELG